MSIAETVRNALKVLKKGIEGHTEDVDIENRRDARRYLHGNGPFQRFKYAGPEGRTRKAGRSRRKRNAQRVK